MTAALRLESFAPRIVAAAPPPITPAQLVEARLEGIAEGRAAAADESAATVAGALQALAAALAAATAEREARDAAARRDSAALVRSVLARVAPRLRVEALAERVLLELTGRLAATPPDPCRIRCEEDLVAPLRLALASAGITGVEVTVGAGPLEVAVPGGALRIDTAAFEAALDRLIDDFARGEG